MEKIYIPVYCIIHIYFSDLCTVPKGSVLINPDTGTPYLNRNITQTINQLSDTFYQSINVSISRQFICILVKSVIHLKKVRQLSN